MNVFNLDKCFLLLFLLKMSYARCTQTPISSYSIRLKNLFMDKIEYLSLD